MQITTTLGETAVFFKDWNLVLILSPLGMVIAGIIILTLINGVLKLSKERDSLTNTVSDLYSLVAERNAVIHRLTNELEEARS